MTTRTKPTTKAGQEFLSRLRRTICDDHGLALVRDEYIIAIEREAFWQGVKSVEEIAGPRPPEVSDE